MAHDGHMDIRESISTGSRTHCKIEKDVCELVSEKT